MEPAITGNVVESAGARYGLLGIGIVVLAFVVVWIVKRYLAVNDAIGVEREKIAKEREQTIAREQTMRTEHATAIAALRVESRHELDLALKSCDNDHANELRALSERYARELGEHVKLARESETLVRREYADLFERQASELAASSTRNNAVIDKLTERLIATRPRSNPY